MTSSLTNIKGVSLEQPVYTFFVAFTKFTLLCWNNFSFGNSFYPSSDSFFKKVIFHLSIHLYQVSGGCTLYKRFTDFYQFNFVPEQFDR